MAGWLERHHSTIIIALAALLAAAIVYIAFEERDARSPLEIRLDEATPGPIEVYITGAVAQPGVYEVTDGARVIDLLSQAGGFAPDANPEAINLARRLRDEDRVVVPRLGESASGDSGVISADMMNINSATAATLDGLPGIGEVYSQRIVESRTADGPFATTEELVTRDIIPRSTYERIRELIYAGP